MDRAESDTFTDHLPAERFEAVLRSISDGVFTVDTRGRITCFNRAAEAITGYTREEALGEPCHTIFRSNICKEACALRYTLETGQPIVDLAVSVLSREGKEIPLSISTALFRDKDGSVMGGVETFRDLRQVETLRKEIQESYSVGDFVTRSPKLRNVLELLPTIAESESTVLITGESGTGKELVARALHKLSPRSSGPLVAVNSAGIPETLLEAELFGYEPGAFTGANKSKPGRFAMAGGGTLFLDEIGDMAPQLQAKLLRVLQEGTYEALGGVRTLKADVRVVTATNRDIQEMIGAGTFREDLFYRLNVFQLKLPPLRERKEDIPILIDHFIQRLEAVRGKGIHGVSPRALRALLDFDYPGNVRQLENAMEHAYVLSSGSLIRHESLPEPLRGFSEPRAMEGMTLVDMERSFIQETLRRNQFNRTAAARELGIHKSTLYRKVQKLGIPLPTEDGRSTDRG
ncbi:MAG: sigma-54 interaction domain-containing protein [Gemmatimonadota bacterium]